MRISAKLLFFSTAILVVASPAMAQVVVSDVSQFYRVLDAADGRPTAAILQRDYLDVGSKGLHDFIPAGILSAENLANQVANHPEVFARARSCTSAFPAMEERTPQLIGRIKAIYAPATNPRVTIVIGARNSGGTTSPEVGVILGLETTCENRTHSELPPDVRLTTILAHELIHTQQRGFAGATVLAESLTEGVAEFIGELVSGHTVNGHLMAWTKGKEAEIETQFRADTDKTDLSAWLYNNVGTPQQPGDLGYWVGYRIAKSFYDRAPDKRVAIARLLEETDAKALLRDSGW